MANTNKIERAAVRAVEEYLDKCPKLEPNILSNDNNPLWDGDIIVYSGERHNISSLVSRITVILKGTTATSSNNYRIPREYIEAYKNIGGGIFFLVQISEESSKIFYSFLSVYEIEILQHQNSGNLKIELEEVPDDPLDFEKKVFEFAVDRNKYKKIELWSESLYVSSLKTECEKLNNYLGKIQKGRDVLESKLNSIKRIDRGDSSVFIQDIRGIIEIVQDNKIDDSVLLMNLLINFASFLQEQNDFLSAEQYFKEAQKYAVELANQNSNNNGKLIESTEKLMGLYNEANEQDVLVDTLSESIIKYLELCKTDPISYTEPLAKSYKKLAECYFKKEKFRKAESNFIDALNLFFMLAQTNAELYNTIVIDILRKLYRIHKWFRKYEVAKQDITDSLYIYNNCNMNNNLIDKAMAIAESAFISQINQNFTEAENLYCISKNFIDRLNTKPEQQYNKEKAYVMASLADLYSKKGNFFKAEKLFTDSIALYNQIGDSTTDIIANKARAIFMYGNFYASSNPKEAENKYIEALSIQQKIKSTDKYLPEYIDTLFASIRLNPSKNDSSNRFVDALESLFQFVKIDSEENVAFLKIFLKTSTDLYKDIRIGNQISSFFEKVEKTYKNYLIICRELENNNQEEYEEYVVDVLSCLARFYLASEKYEDAENSYKELLDKCRKIAEHRTDYNKNVALSLIDLGKLYHIYPSHNSDAETCFIEALEILQKLEKIGFNKYGAEIAATYYNLGNLYRSLERKLESEAQFYKAMQIYRHLSSNNSKEYNEKVAQTAENIAYLLIDDENRKDEATKALKKAIDYYDNLANSESQSNYKYEEKIKQLKNTLNRLSNRQKISSSLKIERAAVRAVEEYLDKCPKLEPHIVSTDETLFWDGYITVFKNKSHSNKAVFARIPVQVKGSYIAKGNTFNIRREHIEAYKFERGAAFFWVQEDEDKNKILYALLSSNEIDSLLKNYPEGNVKIHLQEVPTNPLYFEQKLYKFAVKRNSEKKEKTYLNEIQNLMERFEKIRGYMIREYNDTETRIFYETYLDSIKKLNKSNQDDGTIGWRYKFIYYSQKAIDLVTKKYEGDDAFELLHDFGLYLYNQKYYHLVENYYLKALEYLNSAKPDSDSNSEKLAVILNDLGCLHRALTRYDQAEKEYNGALGIRRELVNTNRNAYIEDVAETLNNLGFLHSSLNRYDEAEEEYKEALRIRRELARKNREAYIGKVAEILNNLGFLHSNLNRFDKAEKEYKEALEIRRELARKKLEANIGDVAETLNNLGFLYNNLNRFDKAEKEYQEALEIRRELVRNNREAYIEDVAVTLNNLGFLHRFLSRYDEAENEHVEALEIRRELAKANREAYIGDVAVSLNNLGFLHSSLNRYDEAEEEYKEALRIRRELARKNREAYIGKVAEVLNNLGFLHSNLDRFAEAEKEYKEALRIRRELARRNHEAYIGDVAVTLNNLGFLHNNLNRFDEAEKEYKEALEIRRELAKTNYEAYIGKVAMTLDHYARLLLNYKERRGEAKQKAKEALDIYSELARKNQQIWMQYEAKTQRLHDSIL